jgi:activator of HSP90 ATPase
MLTNTAIALGAFAFGSTAFAEIRQQTAAASEHGKLTSLHQVIEIKATSQRIYDALLSSKQFAAFSGLPAEIDPKAGGAFSMFGGQIVGRNIELVPNRRIVQAWRPTHWDPGVYSAVKFELNPKDDGTAIVLDHTGFPEGEFDSLSSGWVSHYWEPLKKFFA